MSQPTLTPPSFEQHPTGLGIGFPEPRISWRFDATEGTATNWQQTAYEIEVARGDNTQSYTVKSAESALAPWPSQPLQSREVAKARVRAYGGPRNAPTDWSAWGTVEAGLLDRKDWNARAITTPVKQKEGPLRPVRFRKTFTLSSGAVSRARLYITSLGVFQAYINGEPVGDHCMAPGWTSYHNRLNYEVFDVASLLRDGENTIAVEVSEGWWATRLGFHGGRRFIYGDELALFAQLEVTPERGDALVVATESSWKSHQSAIIRSEIYDGELYDAREEQDSWKSLPFALESSWNATREIELPDTQLVAPNAPPVRVAEAVNPIEIIRTPSGKVVVDFGQNLVGRVRIHSIKKPAGHSTVLTHAEVLENKELGTRPLRVAKCQDEIISAGQEIRDWVPRFTFHGFRYVQVDGWGTEMVESTWRRTVDRCTSTM